MGSLGETLNMILLQVSLLSLLLIKCSSAQENPRDALTESVNDLTLKMYNSLASEGNQENFVFSL